MLFGEKVAEGFDAFDLIHKFTSPMMALLFAELFWPEFVEIDNMVFLATTFEDTSDLKRLNNAVKHYQGDLRKVEESFNTVEVPSLFGARMGDTTNSEDLLLAEILAAMWRARLSEKFPDRKFVVEVIGPAETGNEVAVLFRQAK
jgi:hypothetical protein